MKLLDRKTAQVLLTALIFALGLLFLYAAWRAIIAFLFAVFFAYLLEAPVNRLQRWFRGSRTAAIVAVYAIFVAIMVLVFALAAPPVIQEGQKLMQHSQGFTRNISSGEILRQHGWSQEAVERVQGFLAAHRQEVIDQTQGLVLQAVQSIQNMWWLLLVPILAIFFLKDGRKFGETIINSVKGPRNRQIVAATVEEINLMLGGFIRAQLLLAALAMLVLTFVLWAMRVPYAFALGPAAGALEFIPVVGPIMGGVLVLGVAFFAGYNHLIWTLIVLLIWRGVQDYFSSPRIMGEKLELHPLAVLFGVFAGGEVAGVIGVFLSIPVLASLRILWHTWQLYRRSHSEKPAVAEHVATK